jgi:hypothetical protein
MPFDFFTLKVKNFSLLVEMKTKALQKNILANLQVNYLIKSWLDHVLHEL